MIVWTDERIAEARAHAVNGLSASKIGEAMGVTKNAIIGLHKRKGLGLQIVGVGGRASSDGIPKPRGPIAGRDVPDRRKCKFIEGDVPGGRYCGHKTKTGPWCAYHYNRVFAIQPAAKEKARTRKPILAGVTWQ